MMASLNDLATLQTEQRNSLSSEIDQVSTIELCQIINQQDATIAASVARCIPSIAGAIDCLAARVRRGGRVIYVGAGTSGR
jgi:N-acetylmuramic acid 6-phosphate etherase